MPSYRAAQNSVILTYNISGSKINSVPLDCFIEREQALETLANPIAKVAEEEKEILLHVLASYEVRNLHLEYSPPVHLQQLRKALVSREELKRVEEIPASTFTSSSTACLRVGHFPGKKRSAEAEADIARVLSIWRECRIY